MRISVIGCGYVGLVTGNCIANSKNSVNFYDISKEKLTMLKHGKTYISEPGLDEIFLKNKSNGFLNFSENIDEVVINSDVIIVAVNTPPKNTGECNTDNLLDVIKDLVANYSINGKVIIIKSTVSVGTTKYIQNYISKYNRNVKLFYNPEFLSQGNAVNDFLKPNKIVIGYDGKNCFRELIYEIYSNCELSKNQFIFTNYETAELIKYSCNCFLALRISYINLISQIADKFNADILAIEKSMKLDPRIGGHYLSSGLGFGGSCLTKDLSALNYICNQNNINSDLLSSIMEINNKQIEIAAGKISKKINNFTEKIVLFGLSFKGNTNDIRCSQGIELVKYLIKLGYKNIYVYEPLNVELPNLNVKFSSDDVYKCVQDAKLIVICNNNYDYNSLSWDKIGKMMKDNIIFDFRNILDKYNLQKKGFNVIGFNER